jgi:hypothetical protein
MDLDGFEFGPPESTSERRARLGKKHPTVSRQELLQAIREYPDLRLKTAHAYGALKWHAGGRRDGLGSNDDESLGSPRPPRRQRLLTEDPMDRMTHAAPRSSGIGNSSMVENVNKVAGSLRRLP